MGAVLGLVVSILPIKPSSVLKGIADSSENTSTVSNTTSKSTAASTSTSTSTSTKSVEDPYANIPATSSSASAPSFYCHFFFSSSFSTPSKFESPLVPRDDEGFVTAYAVEDVAGIRQFFDKYGFVIIKDVIDNEQATALLDEIWKNCQERKKLVSKDDPITWDYIPSGSVGILGSLFTEQTASWDVRQSPRLRQAYAAVLRTDDLLVSLDRFGFLRPTVGIKMPDGTVVDKPNWKTAAQWFHWDLNPWFYLSHRSLPTLEEDLDRMMVDEKLIWEDPLNSRNYFPAENNDRPKVCFKGSEKVQGLLAVLDAREEDGGFICVPGFHKYLSTWIAKNKKCTSAHFVSLNYNEAEIAENAQKIPMRKGSLCVWSSELPHCNYPNNSDQFRACFYVKMFPRTSIPLQIKGYLKSRANAVLEAMPKGYKVTEHGKKVFGLDALES